MRFSVICASSYQPKPVPGLSAKAQLCRRPPIQGFVLSITVYSARTALVEPVHAALTPYNWQ